MKNGAALLHGEGPLPGNYDIGHMS